MTGSHFLAAPAFQRTIFHPKPQAGRTQVEAQRRDDEPSPLIAAVVRVLLRHQAVYEEVLAEVRGLPGWAVCIPEGAVT